MATIKDVARLAEVSISTVSRALSKKIYVEEQTRERVLAAVRTLNYKPNFMAKGLKEGCTNTLALIVPDILNPFYPKLVKSFEKYAFSKGYSIVLYDTNEDTERELQYFEMLKSRSADGVLLISTSDDITHLLAMVPEGIPLVVVNRDFSIDVECITNDNQAGGHAVIEHLLSQGHRKICCMFGDLSLQRYRQRYEGCRQAFREAGVDGVERYMVRGVQTIEDAYAQTLDILTMDDPPTAFFAFVDMIAIGIYSGVAAHGLRVPDDVSVAGFDNISISQHMIPPLTTYEHPVNSIARAAIDSIIRQIEFKEAPTLGKKIISGNLVIRGSVGPCAEAVGGDSR